MRPAVIFDRNSFTHMNPNDLAAYGNPYCCQSMYENIEERLMGELSRNPDVIFGRDILGYSSAESLQIARDMALDGHIPHFHYGSWKFNELLFLELFEKGEGVIIDERGNDRIARDFRDMSRLIGEFKDYVPKFFATDIVGERRAVKHVKKKYLAEQYRHRLEPLKDAGLSDSAEETLIQMMLSVAKGRRNCITTKGLGEDMDIVATAYCVPERRVLIYSEDRDITSLVLMASEVLDYDKQVFVRSSRRISGAKSN